MSDSPPLAGPAVAVRTWCLLFLASFGVLGFCAHGYLENTDTEITMHAAWAWATRGDPGLVSAADVGVLVPADAQPTLAEGYIAGKIDQGEWGLTGRNGKRYIQYSIGHQAIMVPCIWVGEWLTSIWPEPAAAFLAEGGGVRGHYYWAQVLISFLSPLAGAASIVVLLLLSRALGAGARDSLLAVGAATLCTQFLPGTSETMSDAPGMLALLTMAMAIARYQAELWRGRGLLVAGVAGGCAVLLRYPHAVPVVVLTVWAVVLAWRRRRVAELWWLVAGGAPFAALLVGANLWRFGDPFETGYSAGANAAWWSYPMYLGCRCCSSRPARGSSGSRRRCGSRSPSTFAAPVAVSRRSPRSSCSDYRCWSPRGPPGGPGGSAGACAT